MPKETLQTIINNTFHAPVGNLAQNSHHVVQTAQVGLSTADLTKLVSDLRTHIADLNLDPADAKRVEAQLKTIDAQIVVDEPNPIIVREAGKTIRSITEQAIAGVITTAATQPGVWGWIHSALEALAT